MAEASTTTATERLREAADKAGVRVQFLPSRPGTGTIIFRPSREPKSK
jgi:hypothetical protein